ncbi:NAD(P)-dependent oxidoreductase [Methanobrevibacter sp. DSM 116169]|uniref:NAD(P)-dependent oxidoreductase n=1 Tax=Methanobrevibacter sp. DSM 116169 TaxID=3242727 RepID=UPI0038FCEEFA
MIVGFIGFGDVNYHINELLSKNGIKTITSCDERSNKTIKRIKNSNIEILDSFKSVASNCDLLIDATSPKQALNNFNKYFKFLDGYYLDLNNISPNTVKKFESENFIDGAIIGKISSSEPIIIASGEKALKLEFLNDCNIDFKVISSNIGDASLLKSLRSSYTKSLAAILIESVEIAENFNLKEEFFNILAITEGNSFKNKSTSRISNSIKHKNRKIEELEELIEFFNSQDTTMIKASKEKFKKI